MEQINLNAYLVTEQLHRKVFDTIYVQSKTTLDDKDKKSLKDYYQLCKHYPDFREKLFEEYQLLQAINFIAPHRLSPEDIENLAKLNKINFSRYGFK